MHARTHTHTHAHTHTHTTHPRKNHFYTHARTRTHTLTHNAPQEHAHAYTHAHTHTHSVHAHTRTTQDTSNPFLLVCITYWIYKKEPPMVVLGSLMDFCHRLQWIDVLLCVAMASRSAFALDVPAPRGTPKRREGGGFSAARPSQGHRELQPGSPAISSLYVCLSLPSPRARCYPLRTRVGDRVSFERQNADVEVKLTSETSRAAAAHARVYLPLDEAAVRCGVAV